MTKRFKLEFYAEIVGNRVKTYERLVNEDELLKLTDAELDKEARKHALRIFDDVYCTVEEIKEYV